MIKKLIIGACALIAMSASANAEEHLKSLNPAYFDPATAASEDFYTHINKGWMDANPLTPEHARYGQFNILNDSSQNRVRDIVTNLAASNPKPGTVAFMVSTIYNQSLDSVRRNAEGAKPILADIKKIESTPHDSIYELVLWMQKNYSSPFFSASPSPDLANSNEYAMYLSGTGLGMGDRDYYLLNDKDNKKVRDAYRKLIVTQMRNAGFSKKDANRICNNVMKVETAIADSTWTREESRNIPAMYNPYSLERLKAEFPGADWDSYFEKTMGIATP